VLASAIPSSSSVPLIFRHAATPYQPEFSAMSHGRAPPVA
jgi:hypothetical protein